MADDFPHIAQETRAVIRAAKKNQKQEKATTRFVNEMGDYFKDPYRRAPVMPKLRDIPELTQPVVRPSEGLSPELERHYDKLDALQARALERHTKNKEYIKEQKHTYERLLNYAQETGPPTLPRICETYCGVPSLGAMIRDIKSDTRAGTLEANSHKYADLEFYLSDYHSVAQLVNNLSGPELATVGFDRELLDVKAFIEELGDKLLDPVDARKLEHAIGMGQGFEAFEAIWAHDKAIMSKVANTLSPALIRKLNEQSQFPELFGAIEWVARLREQSAVAQALHEPPGPVSLKKALYEKCRPHCYADPHDSPRLAEVVAHSIGECGASKPLPFHAWHGFAELAGSPDGMKLLVAKTRPPAIRAALQGAHVEFADAESPEAHAFAAAKEAVLGMHGAGAGKSPDELDRAMGSALHKLHKAKDPLFGTLVERMAGSPEEREQNGVFMAMAFSDRKLGELQETAVSPMAKEWLGSVRQSRNAFPAYSKRREDYSPLMFERLPVEDIKTRMLRSWATKHIVE